MIEHVDKTIRDHECTLIAAPTGIGKTVAVLYPALQHALRDGLRVFFVTAKTTQQTLAVDTLQRFAANGGAFTAVHLRAKAKSCVNEVFYCHESVCEFAHDYAGKLERSGVVASLLERPLIGPTACAEAAFQYRVCPFELSLDAAMEADVIIAITTTSSTPAPTCGGSFRTRLTTIASSSSTKPTTCTAAGATITPRSCISTPCGIC